MPEAPPAPPEIEAPPPSPTHAEQSKGIFKQARIDAGLDQPPPPPTPPAPDPVPPVEGDKSKKGVVPDDVIDPSKDTPPAPSEAIAAIEAMVLPKNAKPEQVANFNKLKGTATETISKQEKVIADLQKKIEGSTDKTELEGLKGKLTAAEEKARDIEERFSRVAFQESPRFKAQFVDQEKAALDGAKSCLEGTDIKPELVELAANSPIAKRGQILRDAGIDPDLVGQILPHLAQYDTVQRGKKAALEDWKAHSADWRAEDEKRAEAIKARRTEQTNKVWDKVVSGVDLLPLRQSKDNQDWNARREGILAESKDIFNGKGATDEQYAERILKGGAYDAQQEVIDHLIEENKTLRTENQGLKSAAPGGTITANRGGDSGLSDTSKMSRDEVAKSTFNAEKQKAASA